MIPFHVQDPSTEVLTQKVEYGEVVESESHKHGRRRRNKNGGPDFGVVVKTEKRLVNGRTR